MAWNNNLGVFGGEVGNYSLRVKYIFLRFLQAYFSEHPRYTWESNPAKSKILIMDKYAINISVVGKQPAIVLSRGPMRFLNASIYQRESVNLLNMSESYLDLMETSVTLSCITRGGQESEELANILLNILTAYKNELKAAGIYQIRSINISEEQQLRADSEENVTATNVNVTFTIPVRNTETPKFYYVEVNKSAFYVSPNPTAFDDVSGGASYGNWRSGTWSDTLAENIDYTVISGGSYLQFATAPEAILSIVSGYQVVASGVSDGSSPNVYEGSLILGQPQYTVTYMSAITLTTQTTTITGDSSKTTYLMNPPIYGYGPLMYNVFVNSGISAPNITKGGYFNV